MVFRQTSGAIRSQHQSRKSVHFHWLVIEIASRSWYERSANAEPSLIYSGIFSVMALGIPVGYHYYTKATGKSNIHDMSDKPVSPGVFLCLLINIIMG